MLTLSIVVANIPKLDDGSLSFYTPPRLHEPMIIYGLETPTAIIETLPKGKSIRGKRRLPLLSLMAKQADQLSFVTEFFKILNLDRINTTLPEAIDFLFHILSSFDSDIKDLIRNKKKSSILSSLSYNLLKEILGSGYTGFPDYQNMLFSILTGTQLQSIKISYELNQSNQPYIRSEDFDLERFKYIKKFDLAKVLNLSRAYGYHTSSPPYFNVTCNKPDEKLEQWYRKVNQDNYISVLNILGIRTDDNPTYYQALGRMTIIHSMSWIHLMLRQQMNIETERLIINELISDELGIPYSVLDEIDMVAHTPAEYRQGVEHYLRN